MKSVSELYGLYPGSDLYIVGTGPSLRVFPLSFFEGKVTIGLNDAYRWVPVRYAITIHPDLYIPEFLPEGKPLPDTVWITKHEKTKNLVSKEALERAEERFYFFESKGGRNTQPPYEPNDEGRVLDWARRPTGRFLYQWSSISQTAVNLAANMGAKNIYLVGCDCASLDGNDHAHAKPTRWKGADPQKRYRQYYEGLAEVRLALRERGVNLVSLTPFVGLDDLKRDFRRLCGEFEAPISVGSPPDRSPAPVFSEWLGWLRNKARLTVKKNFHTGVKTESPSYSVIRKWRHFMENGQALSFKRTPLIESGSKIFCIGSCFALEIKKALKTLGYDVRPAEEGLGTNEPGVPFTDPGRHLVHYNSFTILQEFEKAFGLWSQGPEDFWVVRNQKRGNPLSVYFQDPYRREVYSKTKQGIWELTKTFDDAIKKGIFECDVYILTLGLTEVWKKKDDGRVACANPGYGEGGGQGETFFLKSGFNENYANIKKVAELLQSRFPSKPIVLTVSPVPMAMTFTDQDVFVANTESKSTLRAVAGQICEEFQNVHYFPAFEMCAAFEKQGRRGVFRPDGRHVAPETVDSILKTFMKSCVFKEKPKSLKL